MCVLCRYTKYVFSETHGVPGVLSVAVDFYAQTDAPKHSCCEPQGGLLCLGKPVKLTVDGVRYCCPRGATEQQPCPNKTFVIESAGEQDGVVAPMDEDLAQPVPTAAAAVATAVEAIEEMAEKEEKMNEEARVTGSCPDLASLRSSRVLAAGFSAAALSGMWYEQAFVDVAQLGASCQTLNGTASADGTLSVDFAVTYLGRAVPFTMAEVYEPNTSHAGLYTKHALVPGGKLLRLPTVVVDVTAEAYVLFSCLELPLLPPLTELVVATRTRRANETLVQSRLALAARLGVPVAPDDVQRVDHSGCP